MSAGLPRWTSRLLAAGTPLFLLCWFLGLARPGGLSVCSGPPTPVPRLRVPSTAAPADAEEPTVPMRVVTGDPLLGPRAGKEGAGEEAARPGSPSAHLHLETPPLFMLGSVTHDRSLLPPGTIFGRRLPFSRSEMGHTRGTQWQGQASPWCLASMLALSLPSAVRGAQKREHCPLGAP